MLKTLMISAAAGALMVSGAMAQTNPPSAPQQPSPPSMQDKSNPGSSAKFIASQSANQWAFSKFEGTDVLGPDNAHIGDVNDVLFDQSGKVVGLIIGVGGFLGIGEKNVAIDMSAFDVVPANTSTTGSGSNAGSVSDPTTVKLKVAWTKEQLNAAPSFKYYNDTRTTDRAPANNTAPNNTAPRPGAPSAPTR